MPVEHFTKSITGKALRPLGFVIIKLGFKTKHTMNKIKIDRRYKFHYIKVREKGCLANVVARVNVSHLNERGINAEWDRLDEKYPSGNYISCLESRNDEVRTFENPAN